MNARGFTLVDLCTALGVTAVLAAMALPSYHGRIVKGRRADAVAALGRLQAAAERYRSDNGSYTADLNALHQAPQSMDGLYDVAITLTSADIYRATATARAGTSQADDIPCAQFVLDVNSGFAMRGPAPSCWAP